MQIPLWLSITAVLMAAACSSGSGEERVAPEPPPPDRDIHSFARPWEARVTHVALDLTADFASKTLAGKATLNVERTPAAHEVVLDTRDLTIESATAQDGRTLKFNLGTEDPILGRPLTVELPAGRQDDHDRLPHLARRRRAAVAGAVADGREGAPLSLLAGPGDPHAHLDPDAGQPRHPPDLRRAGHRAARPARRHERRAAHPRGRHGARGARVRVQADAGDPAVPHRARRRRSASSGRSVRAPACTPSPRSWRPPRTSSRTWRRWSRRPNRCSDPIAGGATTCWCCRRRSPSAGWRIRGSRSPRPRCWPATSRSCRCSRTSSRTRGAATW